MNKLLKPFNDAQAPNLIDLIYLLGMGALTGTILGMFVSSMYLFGVSAWPI